MRQSRLTAWVGQKKCGGEGKVVECVEAVLRGCVKKVYTVTSRHPRTQIRLYQGRQLPEKICRGFEG